MRAPKPQTPWTERHWLVDSRLRLIGAASALVSVRSSAKVISLPSGSLTVAAFTNPGVPCIGPTCIHCASSAASCSSRLLNTRVTLDDPARSA